MKPTVLVVEDNLDSAVILRSILEHEGCRVEVVDNGSEALEQLAVALPDVVLLDVMMPGLSGLDVLESIRRHHRTTRLPVILVTAKTLDDDVMGGYQRGADYYITKPFTAKQLVYGLRMVLGESPDPGCKENEDLG